MNHRVKQPDDLYVPVDEKAFVVRDGKQVQNKNHTLSRGFAIVYYRKRDALAALRAQELLDGLRYNGSTLVARFEKGQMAVKAAVIKATEARAKAVAAAEAVEKALMPAAPCELTQVEFPTLPEPAPKQEPVPVVRRVERDSDTASESAASSAPTVHERWRAMQALHIKCTYCKATGHGIQGCPKLAAATCNYCGCAGHTEKKCALKKAEAKAAAEYEREEAEWLAYDAHQALKVEQRAEAFAQREAEEARKAAGLVAAAVIAPKAGVFDCLECEEAEEPQQEEVCAVEAPAEAAAAAAALPPPKAKRPSKAQRQAAKRVAAKQALAVDTSEC